MERQKPVNSVHYNDEFSKALIEGTVKRLGEEGIPTLDKSKEKQDDTSKKDPKANASSPDPAVDLRTGSGIKQSHGAEIKDTTKLVTKESCDTYEFELDGFTYVFEAEKKKGLDGKACWKGYKQMGTKMKGGKKVDNCVKAGDEVEHDGEELQEKSVSKAQQRFMGMVHAKKKGEMKGGSKEVDKASKSMTGKEAEKFNLFGARRKEGHSVGDWIIDFQ